MKTKKHISLLFLLLLFSACDESLVEFEGVHPGVDEQGNECSIGVHLVNVPTYIPFIGVGKQNRVTMKLTDDVSYTFDYSPDAEDGKTERVEQENGITVQVNEDFTIRAEVAEGENDFSGTVKMTVIENGNSCTAKIKNLKTKIFPNKRRVYDIEDLKYPNVTR